MDIKQGLYHRQEVSQRLEQRQQLNQSQILIANLQQIPDQLSEDIFYTLLENPFVTADEEFRREILEMLDSARRYGRGSFIHGSADEDFDSLEFATPEESLREHLLKQLYEEVRDERKKKIGEVIINSIDEKGMIPDHPVKRKIEYYEAPENNGKSRRRRRIEEEVWENPWEEVLKSLIKNQEEEESAEDDREQELLLDPPATLDEVEEVLRIIQSFDPPGVGARNYIELLEIQLRDDESEEGKIAKRIIEALKIEGNKILEDIERRRINNLASILNLSHDDVIKGIEKLKSLNPNPGSAFSSQKTKFTFSEDIGNEIIPIATIKKVKSYRMMNGRKEAYDDIVVEYNRRFSSGIKLNLTYWEEVVNKFDQMSEEEKKFLQEKWRDAKNQITALQRSESILERVTEELVKKQRDYILTGDELQLKPLTIKELARNLGVDDSSVSRAVSRRYIQLPNGEIIPFKKLFPRSISSSNVFSDEKKLRSEALRELQKLIEAEPPDRPFSDKELSELLKKKGFEVARRTVLKYREELGIPNRSERKKMKMAR